MKAFLAAAAVAASLLVGLAAPSASAAILIIGGGQAEACYKAAKAGKADNPSLELCNAALETENLTPEDRGGTLVNRGVIELRQGRYETAHADFDAGISLNPKVGEGWVNRGAMFLGEHRYKEALADINKALSLGLGEPAKAYYDRAIAYEGLDDEKSAYLDYQQALTLAPGWDLPQHELLRFTVTQQ